MPWSGPTLARASNKRKRRPARPAAAPVAGRSRSEQKDAAARARLEPLREGERPVAVTVAAGVATLLGLANGLFFVLGVDIGGEEPNAGVLAYSGLMLIAAWGMWRARYWAVLGMQAILAIIVVLFSLFLVRASNLLAALIALTIAAAAGTLFWFLVKALARIQMPDRR
jgi:hypothetical protein